MNFPCYMYHEKEGAKLFSSEEELDEAGESWVDSPKGMNLEKEEVVLNKDNTDLEKENAELKNSETELLQLVDDLEIKFSDLEKENESLKVLLKDKEEAEKVVVVEDETSKHDKRFSALKKLNIGELKGILMDSFGYKKAELSKSKEADLIELIIKAESEE